MWRYLSIMATSAVMLVSFAFSTFASDASIGAGNPYPVSRYTCEDGTRLGVRLFGDRASVYVDDAGAIDLPATGIDGTSYSNGQSTLTIVHGRLSWSGGQAAQSACTGG